MSLQMTTIPELTRRAFDILEREMGLVDTMRFFGQLGLGGGNYTEERRALFADLTLDEYRKSVGESHGRSTNP